MENLLKFQEIMTLQQKKLKLLSARYLLARYFVKIIISSLVQIDQDKRIQAFIKKFIFLENSKVML